jgi:cytochrome P450
MAQQIQASASTIALHHNPAVFPAPHVFNPKRWLGLTPEQLQCLERSFIPFGYGARMCLGKAFATLELKLLTASLYLRYYTKVDPDSATTPETMWQTGTMDSVPSGLRCDLLLRPVA